MGRTKKIRVYTIGHSTRTLDEFIGLLNENGIRTLADIRGLPGSRAYPHFNRENLERALPAVGIKYVHLPLLGGRRRSPKAFASPNTALTSPAFRSYADYMASPDFLRGIEQLLDLVRGGNTAYMCAEAVYWRCHRRLVSDYLTAHGVEVVHIMGPHQLRSHTMMPEAHLLKDGTIIYPAVEAPAR